MVGSRENIFPEADDEDLEYLFAEDSFLAEEGSLESKILNFISKGKDITTNWLSETGISETAFSIKDTIWDKPIEEAKQWIQDKAKDTLSEEFSYLSREWEIVQNLVSHILPRYEGQEPYKVNMKPFKDSGLFEDFEIDNKDKVTGINDAIRHFAASQYVAEKHGKLLSFASGAYHELIEPSLNEGSEYQSLPGISDDMYHNTIALFKQAPITATEFIDILDVSQGDWGTYPYTYNMSEEDYQKVSSYIRFIMDNTKGYDTVYD